MVCGRLIKEFEREARTDGISAAELANRKKAMVQELNNFISMKKERSADLDARKELVAGGSPSKAPQTINGGDIASLITMSIMQACLNSLRPAKSANGVHKSTKHVDPDPQQSTAAVLEGLH